MVTMRVQVIKDATARSLRRVIRRAYSTAFVSTFSTRDDFIGSPRMLAGRAKPDAELLIPPARTPDQKMKVFCAAKC